MITVPLTKYFYHALYCNQTPNGYLVLRETGYKRVKGADCNVLINPQCIILKLQNKNREVL